MANWGEDHGAHRLLQQLLLEDLPDFSLICAQASLVPRREVTRVHSKQGFLRVQLDHAASLEQFMLRLSLAEARYVETRLKIAKWKAERDAWFYLTTGLQPAHPPNNLAEKLLPLFKNAIDEKEAAATQVSWLCSLF